MKVSVFVLISANLSESQGLFPDNDPYFTAHPAINGYLGFMKAVAHDIIHMIPCTPIYYNLQFIL